MYRVYDLDKQKWLKSGIYLSPNPHSELYTIKKSRFGKEKLCLVPSDKYVIHKEIGMCDKNNVVVHEGDFVKAKISEEKTLIGLVTFADELSSYIILCSETSEWYSLGSEVCEFIEVIGNVFDGYKEEELDGQQAL